MPKMILFEDKCVTVLVSISISKISKDSKQDSISDKVRTLLRYSNLNKFRVALWCVCPTDILSLLDFLTIIL